MLKKMLVGKRVFTAAPSANPDKVHNHIMRVQAMFPRDASLDFLACLTILSLRNTGEICNEELTDGGMKMLQVAEQMQRWAIERAQD